MSSKPFISTTSPAPIQVPSNGHRTYRPPCEDLACRLVLVGGRRCRRAAGRTGTGLCIHHDRQLEQFRQAESRSLAVQAIGTTRRFTSVMSVNRVMGRVLTLGLARRYSTRELFVFTYAAKLILNTIPGANDEIQRADGYSAEESRLQDLLGINRAELDRIHDATLHQSADSYESRNSDFDNLEAPLSDPLPGPRINPQAINDNGADADADCEEDTPNPSVVNDSPPSIVITAPNSQPEHQLAASPTDPLQSGQQNIEHNSNQPQTLRTTEMHGVVHRQRPMRIGSRIKSLGNSGG